MIPRLIPQLSNDTLYTKGKHLNLIKELNIRLYNIESSIKTLKMEREIVLRELKITCGIYNYEHVDAP